MRSHQCPPMRSAAAGLSANQPHVVIGNLDLEHAIELLREQFCEERRLVMLGSSLTDRETVLSAASSYYRLHSSRDVSVLLNVDRNSYMSKCVVALCVCLGGGGAAVRLTELSGSRNE